MSYDKCVRCGSCVKFCPMFDAIGEEQFSPRGKNYLLQVMDEIEDDAELAKEFRRLLFQCSMCGKCAEICSSDVDLLQIWHKQRAKAYETAPEEFEYLDALKNALANVRNIYGLPMDDRAIYWVDEIEMSFPNIEDRLYEKGKTADVMVFLGCLMSFRGSQIDVLKSFITMLEELDIKYLVMGAEEFCCGHPLDLAGDEEGAKDLQKHNRQVIKSAKAKQVITCCPGCLMQLRNHHQLDAEVLHHTQFFDRLLDEIPSYNQTESFAYHDPCELHRLCEVKVEPRSLLRKMDIDYREMELSCCGGGGLLRLTDPNLSDKIIQLRAQKENLENTTVITCCPACREQLLGTNLKTKDIVELIDQSFRGE
ncbi:MAG: 4Fe-4S dicluster domain-containing protein [Candidatus Lokiarchaeota archaeon]|nr:4Fe-4S dicluster domain-containing protein [Candidatus Lokiarchaeota archaeon]